MVYVVFNKHQLAQTKRFVKANSLQKCGFFSAQPSIILILSHNLQDFFGQIKLISKFSQ